MTSRGVSRRRFLHQSLQTMLVGAGLTALPASLGSMQALAASPRADYRALVCIFLAGGNDSFNMLVPFRAAAYNTYADTRRSMAVGRDSLLPLAGSDYAVHPAMPEVQSLYDSGQLAMVSNVGSLVQPVTLQEVVDGTATLPPQLFSHNDQTDFWQKLSGERSYNNGWGGRMADLLGEAGSNSLAMNISLSGSNYWQTGDGTFPFSVNWYGADTLWDIDPASTDERTKLRTDTFQALLSSTNLLQGEFGRVQAAAMRNAGKVNDALQGDSALTTAFPESDLGRSLAMTARMIEARQALGSANQVFFILTGGWDTHSGQLLYHEQLLANLSESLGAFYDATVEMGMQNQVTTFTASEFGRTLTSNGDGTDHGWGGNQMVMGGSVRGGQIYGSYPDLSLGSALDVGDGRLIPTLSIDQYGATLARWYADFSDAELATIFPNLSNFSTTTLDFMTA